MRRAAACKATITDRSPDALVGHRNEASKLIHTGCRLLTQCPHVTKSGVNTVAAESVDFRPLTLAIKVYMRRRGLTAAVLPFANLRRPA